MCAQMDQLMDMSRALHEEKRQKERVKKREHAAARKREEQRRARDDRRMDRKRARHFYATHGKRLNRPDAVGHFCRQHQVFSSS